MKRIALLLALVLALGVTGCGKKQAEDVVTEGQDQVEVTQAPEVTPEAIGDPTAPPSSEPTKTPTKAPTKAPASEATKAPEKAPTKAPTAEPTQAPTPAPTPTQAPTPAPTPVQDTRPLGELMTKITSNLGEMPMTENHTLDKETFEFFTFAEYVEGAEAMASEPMMSSIAHSVVLVRLPNGTDAAAFASKMKANADPRKWLCVEAEKVATASKGNLAILVMSASDKTDKIIANFKNL